MKNLARDKHFSLFTSVPVMKKKTSFNIGYQDWSFFYRNCPECGVKVSVFINLFSLSLMQMDKNKLDRFAMKIILRFAKIEVYLGSTANYKHAYQ